MSTSIFKHYPLSLEDFDLSEIRLEKEQSRELEALIHQSKRADGLITSAYNQYFLENKYGSQIDTKFRESIINPIQKDKATLRQKIEKLLYVALDREFELRFKRNSKAILEDVKKRVNEQLKDTSKLDDVVQLVKQSFKNINNQLIFPYYANTLFYETARFHWNYCSFIKLEGCKKEISEYIMQEAKRKFKEDYGLDSDFDFATLRYNKFIADLRKPHPRMLDSVSVGDDVVIYELENITLQFERFKNLDAFGKKVLIFLIYTYTRFGANEKREINFRISDYMELCGLKSVRNAMDQIRKGQENLFSLSVLARKPKSVLDTPKERRLIADKDSDFKSDFAMVEITNQFIELTKENRYIKLSKLYFRLNLLHYPNSPDMLLKFSEQKSMNFNSRNNDIIRIGAVIEACPNLPKYDEIKSEGRINQRIKDPFFRDLCRLGEVLTFELYTIEKKKISIDEAKELPFEEFENVRIHIKWLNYPERDTKK